MDLHRTYFGFLSIPRMKVERMKTTTRDFTRTKAVFLSLLFAVSGEAFAENAPTTADATNVELPAEEEKLPDDVLTLVPADAVMVAYTEQIERYSQSRGLAALADSLTPLLQVVDEAVDGSVMLAISGSLVNPASWRVTAAARTKQEADEFFRYLADDLVPVWNETAQTRRAGQLRFLPVGGTGRLMLVGPTPVFMTVAVRDGLVFGSTRSREAEDWLTGNELGESFVDGREFARLNDGRSAAVGDLAYVDLRELVPFAVTQLDQTFPGLAEALQIENFESVALIGGSRQRPAGTSTRDLPRSASGLRLAIGVESTERGFVRLLASPPARPLLARVFPQETRILLHGSMERTSTVVDNLNVALSAIDEDIVAEYRQEVAEFKENAGFDPHSEFLACFAGEWAFGMLGPDLKSSLFALRVADSDAVKSMIHRLQVFYDLKIVRESYRRLMVAHALRRAGVFSYAVVDNVLLASPDRETVRAAIDAVLDKKGLSQVPEFATILRHVDVPTSKLLFWDVDKHLAGLEGVREGAGIAALAELGEVCSCLGLALVPHEQMISVELMLGDADGIAVTEVAARVLASSAKRVRHESLRTVSMTNVKNTLTYCMMYAKRHEGQWPRSMEDLVAGGMDAAALFVDPYAPAEDLGEPYYLYRYVPDLGEDSAATELVLSEPTVQYGGAVFGFSDGHAEWIESPRAEELLEIMRRN